MTEDGWLACGDSGPMLEFIRATAGERKLRLFAAAGFRRLGTLLPDPRQRRGIEALERLAEGALTLDACRGVAAGVRHAIPPDECSPGSPPPAEHRHYVALMLFREFRSSRIAAHAVHAADGLGDGAVERREQARLLRDIFGNPFRPGAVHPAWLTPHVIGLARGIYEDRAFDRMPVLGDALEEAGCTDEEILAHCRSPTDHARGCWVVDLILGKA
jgi:hypothetical protein